MVKHILFLKWWLFVTLVTIGGYIAFKLDIFYEIWQQDMTKLSFVIFGLFAFFSLWCGGSTWAVSRAIGRKFMSGEILRRVEYAEDAGWFISDIMLTLGMIGTVCGFIIMLMGGFSDVDVTNPATVQKMLSNLSSGMSTALYTTLVGLVTSVLLKVQLFNLTQGIDTFRRRSNEKQVA